MNFKNSIKTGAKSFTLVKISAPYSLLLTILLVWLKVAGHAAISWWLVFLPVYLGPAIIISVIFSIIAGGITAVAFVLFFFAFMPWLLDKFR